MLFRSRPESRPHISSVLRRRASVFRQLSGSIYISVVEWRVNRGGRRRSSKRGQVFASLVARVTAKSAFFVTSCTTKPTRSCMEGQQISKEDSEVGIKG